MGLPSNTEIQTLDYEYYGLPWAGTPAAHDLSLETLDYEYYGLPWYTNDQGVTTPAAEAAAGRQRNRYIIIS